MKRAWFAKNRNTHEHYHASSIRPLKDNFIRMKKHYPFIGLLLIATLILPTGLSAKGLNYQQPVDSPLTVKQSKTLEKVSIKTTESQLAEDSLRSLGAPDKMPEFPGGDAALFKYLSEKVKYPVQAALNKVQGTPVVRFVITSSGKVDKVEVMRVENVKTPVSGAEGDGNEENKRENAARIKPLLALLNMEAIRVVKSMPDWIPGERDGQKLDVWYSLPIKFTLVN